ncbi:MAG: DNA-binding transcriptional regulator, LysR family [Ramlibacter sp.]|nr:DNA-binding transcriptional regulator, LysR family [Ramlibacter sp.]
MPMRFDLSDLLLFVRVAEAGSITQGAARAHRSLAAASVQIREMEQSLGVPLLVRDRLGVTPTGAGRALLQHSYKLLNGMQLLKDEMSEYADRLKGYVKVYSNSASLMEFLVQPLAQFLIRNPAVDVSVEEIANHLIVDAVAQGKADFGIVSEPVDKKALEAVPFCVDRYVVVAARDGPLQDGATVAFEELLDFDFVGLGRGTWTQVLLEDLARQKGKVFRHRAQLRGFDVACRLAADGAGVALVPERTARRAQLGMPINLVHLSDGWASIPMVLCKLRNADLSVHAQSLIRFLTVEGAAPDAG